GVCAASKPRAEIPSEAEGACAFLFTAFAAPLPQRQISPLSQFDPALRLPINLKSAQSHFMSDTIHLTLPDGSTKDVPTGTVPLAAPQPTSPRVTDAALAAKARPLASSEGNRNGNLIDLTRPLEEDTDLRIITEKDPEALEVYRHSSAHLMAAAVLELFPETK